MLTEVKLTTPEFANTDLKQKHVNLRAVMISNEGAEKPARTANFAKELMFVYICIQNTVCVRSQAMAVELAGDQSFFPVM